MNSIFEKEIYEHLTSKKFKDKILVFECLDSTNNYLKSLPLKTDNSVVIASQQTCGRGRRGRIFFSPEGGLYMSVLINKKDIFDTDLITSLSAVAVAKAIEDVTNLSPQIKWVNDVLLNEKKVCGILTEGILENNMLQSIVIGIGVNVHKTKFPDEIKDIATSIFNETGKEISINILAARILDFLNVELKNMSSFKFLEESRSRSSVLGKEITVLKGDEQYLAKAISINEKGNLIIDINGQTETLFSGEVSIKKAP